MSLVIHERVVEHLTKLRMTHAVRSLDRLLEEAGRKEPSYLAFLDGLLVDEAASRRSKRETMHMQIAHFPSVKTLDAFDFAFQPSIDPVLVRELATGGFVQRAENVLLIGPPGVGKSHLAIGIGRAAVHAGHTVLFTTATALLAALTKAQHDGRLEDKLTYFAKPRLLIVDELGYLCLEPNSANLFFQLVAKRYERSSMLLTTNKSVGAWGEVFGDDVLATAILDRLLHRSHVLSIQGESHRLKEKKKSGLLGNTSNLNSVQVGQF